MEIHIRCEPVKIAHCGVSASVERGGRFPNVVNVSSEATSCWCDEGALGSCRDRVYVPALGCPRAVPVFPR